jgi:hypothetical protein
MTNRKSAVPPAAELTEAPRDPSNDLVPMEVEPVFRDKVYTSRTLILPDGSTASVVAGKIAATNDMLLAFLATAPDFEPLHR